jgi:hypothetical protein
MERKKTGRPSKGDRALVKAKLPRPLAQAIQNEAARRGMTLTDYLGELASRATGVPYEPQERLPISA